jgi:ABC-type transporter Mla subunit MlaD
MRPVAVATAAVAVLLVGAVTMLDPSAFEEGKRGRATVIALGSDAQGLTSGSPVTYRGIPGGRVERLELVRDVTGEAVVARVRLDDWVPEVSPSSVAILAGSPPRLELHPAVVGNGSQGTGSSASVAHAGPPAPDAGSGPAGDAIRPTHTDEIDEHILRVARQLEEMTTRLESLVTSLDKRLETVGTDLEAGLSAFRSAAEAGDRLLRDPRLDSTLDDLSATSEHLRSFTETVDPATLLADLHATVRETRSLLVDIRTVTGQSAETLSRTLDSLQESSLVLQDFLKMVRSSPGMLLAPPRVDE